jgi:hypothetical protein
MYRSDPRVGAALPGNPPISVDRLGEDYDIHPFTMINEGAMEAIERLRKLVEYTCREIINDDHPLRVEAVGGSENLVFEGHCSPGDIGLIIGAPCQQCADPHGHTRVAAVLACETPLQEAVPRVVLEAYESAMAGQGVGHD